jgi:hypothetical protein
MDITMSFMGCGGFATNGTKSEFLFFELPFSLFSGHDNFSIIAPNLAKCALFASGRDIARMEAGLRFGRFLKAFQFLMWNQEFFENEYEHPDHRQDTQEYEPGTFMLADYCNKSKNPANKPTYEAEHRSHWDEHIGKDKHNARSSKPNRPPSQPCSWTVPERRTRFSCHY